MREADSFIRRQVKEIIFDGATKTRNDIIMSMRNTKRRSDRFYSRQRGKAKHFPSKPGQPPAIDSGDLIQSIQFDAVDYKFVIGSIITKPPYPEWLEKPPMKAKYKARPWLDPAIERQTPLITDRIGEVVPNLADRIFRGVR